MESNHRILIVEDSETQAEYLAALLDSNGYQVSIAHNGREGLAKIAESRPSLVISDIVMPVMDGYELCLRIKNSPVLHDLPVLLLTQLSDPTEVIKALQFGANNFLTKPYDDDFLLDSVKDILTTASARRGGQEDDENITIVFGGKQHRIEVTDTRQCIDLLLSTFKNAVRQNADLARANDELAAMQQTLTSKNRELESLISRQNYFIGMVAHDLRSPLTVMLGYCQFLLNDRYHFTPEEQHQFISELSSNSDFMLALVNDLLDISKIEAGKLELNLQRIDLAALIKKNISLNRMLADKKQMLLKYTPIGILPPLRIDPVRTEQILNNLLGNALKYSFPGAEIEIGTRLQENQAVVSVRDSGQGIPAGEIGNLFKPYEKTSVKSTKGELSTGLGLAIVKKIVTLHGGSIWVDSQVGKGTTISFTLPCDGTI